MEVIVHRAHERGRGEYGWLSSRYSFSFADWYEPRRIGFGALRVINDDTIAPSSGFPMHGHRDMEIVTIVTRGAVTHEDSLGSRGTVSAGEVQTMSAGTGVIHSEYNESSTEPLELFQIWITPDTKSASPRYAQKAFPRAGMGKGITLLVAPDSAQDGLPMYQHAWISMAVLDEQSSLQYALHDPSNGVYVFVIDGELHVAGESLGVRDAVGVSGIEKIELTAQTNARALLIEVPLSAGGSQLSVSRARGRAARSR